MPEHASSGRKRQRTDLATAQDQDGANLELPRKRDEEFWFEDGNIILIARDVEFRVFKGILAKHSPLFEDMFSLPPGPPSEATTVAVDSCPVVHISDSPEDFRHVLRVCMPETNLSYSTFAADGELSFAMISGALAVARMAHKYLMSAMLTLVMKYLKRAFPVDFRKWAASPFRSALTPNEAVLAIGAVNLARLIDEPSLLPTALFVCCCVQSTHLLKGLAREDGSIEHLELEDVGRCLDARGRLAEKILILATRIFALSVSKKCAAPEMCREALGMMLEGVGQYAAAFAESDVFSSWLGAYENSFVRLCCQRCQVMLRERDEKERQAVWDELPEIMGVRVDNWVKENP